MSPGPGPSDLNPENICSDLKLSDFNEVAIDKLSDIFERQRALQLALGKDLSKLKPEGQRPQAVKDMVLALTDELHELLNRFPWKPWRNYKFPEHYHPSEVEMKEIKMEIVDALHFFVNLCLIVGLKPDELYSYYVAKNDENFDRIKRGYSRKAV